MKLDIKKTNNPIEKLNTDLKRILKRGNSNGWDILKETLLTLATRQMHIKSTLRFHLTTVRMAKISKRSDCPCCWGCGQEEHSYIASGSANPYNHCGSVWWLLKEVSIYLPQDPAMPLGTLKGYLILPQKHLLNPVHCFSTYCNQKLETT